MAFTGRLGSSDSRLGNIVLGYNARRRNVIRRDSRSPRYRVQVLAFDGTTNFGIGDLLAEFQNAKNIGYSGYMNDVPQAFFTVNQDDPKIALLRGHEGRCHVRIWRNDDLMWTGWGAMEIDASGTDAIFYCYGYAAGMFWMHTDWDQEWTGETVGTIVSDSWTRAKTTLTKSRLDFISTGTIQTPYTTAGGSTEIILPLYSAFYKRILFLMQEMAALGQSDTTHATMFEITHSESPVFNFWRDRSRDLDSLGWNYHEGRGKLATFRSYAMPVFHRNSVLSVGSIPRNVLARKTVSDTTDMDDWGRMQESLFFPWVRDEDELTRVVGLRAARAIRDVPDVGLVFHPGREIPPGAADSQWRIGDKVPVKISRGIVNINQSMQVVGYQVLVVNSQEYTRAIVQEPI